MIGIGDEAAVEIRRGPEAWTFNVALKAVISRP
jgi:hypothetical protein